MSEHPSNTSFCLFLLEKNHVFQIILCAFQTERKPFIIQRFINVAFACFLIHGERDFVLEHVDDVMQRTTVFWLNQTRDFNGNRIDIMGNMIRIIFIQTVWDVVFDLLPDFTKKHIDRTHITVSKFVTWKVEYLIVFLILSQMTVGFNLYPRKIHSLVTQRFEQSSQTLKLAA